MAWQGINLMKKQALNENKAKDIIIIELAIKVFEFLLFFFALILVSVNLSIISMMTLAMLYYVGYQKNIFEKENIGITDMVNKYFSFPILLLLLMLLIGDTSLKLSIIAFSAQGAMKAIATNA
ncbi:MAG: hypothetical protein QXI89_00795 [Candidatus Anstonellales archaeon]